MIDLSIYLFIYLFYFILFFILFIYLFIHLFIYLFIYLLTGSPTSKTFAKYIWQLNKVIYYFIIIIKGWKIHLCFKRE